MARRSGGSGERRQRPHRPHELGPRVYPRGRWHACDLRPWDAGQPTLRDPADPGWPKRGARTEDEEVARRWAWAYVDLHREEAKRDQLGLPSRPELPLREAVQRYLRASERVNVAQRTYEGRRTILGHLEDFFGSEKYATDLRRKDLQAFFNSFIDEGYAASTLRTMSRVLSGFFTHLEAEPNPCRGLRLPEVPQDDVCDWSDDELERIRTAADRVDEQRTSPPSARRAVELALASGLRQQELFALEWHALDPDAFTARVTRQLDRPGKRRIRLKGKRSRTTLILPSWWEWHEVGAKGLVLEGDSGGIGARQSWQLLQRVLDTANLNEQGAGWHRFRHTYARHVLEMGGSLEELQRFLGHSSIRTTERDYDHFRSDAAAETARRRIYGGPHLRAM